MFRKYFSQFLLSLAVVGLSTAFVVAQNAGLRGRVETKGDDGKMVGVGDVVVDCFRTDINGTCGSAKTDKKGNFAFAGLPLGGLYVLSVSRAEYNPELYPNVKAGREDILIVMVKGDGKKLTEAEVRQRLATASTASTTPGEMSADQKKAQAEYEKKVKEIEEKNNKIRSQTEAVQKALNEGTDAYKAKNLNLAIQKFEEGYQANPDYVGSAPVLLNNKASALKERAVGVYNAAAKLPNGQEKTDAMASVMKDLADSADTFNKSLEIIKNAPAADIQDPKQVESNKLNALIGAKDVFRLMVETRQFDASVIATAQALMAEYSSIEKDQAKKIDAQRTIANLFFAAFDYEKAVQEYEKVLALNADDVDSLANIGLSLVTLAYTINDKAKFQQAVNFLQRFLDVAPPNHKLVQSITESINDVKATQNVAPQKGKTPAPAKKRN